MNDKIFGEMNYDGGWTKKEVIGLWGRDNEVRIVVSAYENEEVNEAQQNAYKKLKSDIDKISQVTLKKLKEYMKEIEDDIKVYCNIDSIPDDVFELVTIGDILFMESGSFAIMCKVKWDSHGIAVFCKEGKVEVGPQDIVWLEE